MRENCLNRDSYDLIDLHDFTFLICNQNHVNHNNQINPGGAARAVK
ncbi:hypothetical protein SAMN05216167_102576 [Spirosoma endophyticum]|uniref:Uncharacterized protein n=1 Tax=Spirosoma endophyticum TaxID=662367 RepID=A0A1I1MGT6_9BACT|nr:hypothetical protein SAMN05216167_102576 [Spirosoma endophyticum]